MIYFAWGSGSGRRDYVQLMPSFALSDTGGCKLALFAVELIDHTTTYDTTTWTDIVLSGSLIDDQCVALRDRECGGCVSSGGYVLTGTYPCTFLRGYLLGPTQKADRVT